MDGTLFATLKTSGELHKSMRKRAGVSGIIFALLLMICFSITVATQARMMANFYTNPALWILPMGAIALAWAAITLNKMGKIMQAFLLSSGCMLAIIATLAAGLFPNWVSASNNTSLSLTIANASSSELTLKTMLILALIGLPMVLAYTAWVHVIFKGKVGEEIIY
jgi:cytochrome d ubiquinol oxidase subunit II